MLRALFCTMALGLGSMAQAEDSVFYKSVGDWDISIDQTIQNGCYALASWNGGTVLRIGRDPSRDNFYVLIGNSKWKSLKPNEEYEIEIRFGKRPSWDVKAFGLQFNPGETVYLHTASRKMEFIREFQRAVNMQIKYQGAEIDNLKLTGSSRAWNTVEECQREVDARPKSDDPFASSVNSARSNGSGRKSEDPFAD